MPMQVGNGDQVFAIGRHGKKVAYRGSPLYRRCATAVSLRVENFKDRIEWVTKQSALDAKVNRLSCLGGEAKRILVPRLLNAPVIVTGSAMVCGFPAWLGSSAKIDGCGTIGIRCTLASCG